MKKEELRAYEPFWNYWYLDEGEALGEGSFGSVFRIRREEFGSVQYAAMKVISVPGQLSELHSLQETGMSREEMQQYFLGMVKEIYNEIKLMSELKGHSSILCYEDHEIKEKKTGIGYELFIRMELAESLASYGNRVTLGEADVVKLGKDICQALIICQKHKILHRDIKPANIFVSGDGDFKLGDFGIARTIEAYQLGLSVKGSYSYMAPEVYHSGTDGKYDQRADLYSLGMVLYTYLNEKRIPFLNKNQTTMTPSEQQEALHRRMSGEHPEPLEEVPEELEAIVCKAMAYRVEDRYQTAEDCYQALCDYERKRKEGKIQERENPWERTVMLSAVQMPAEPKAEETEPEREIPPALEVETAIVGDTIQREEGCSKKNPMARRKKFVWTGALGFLAVCMIFGSYMSRAYDVKAEDRCTDGAVLKAVGIPSLAKKVGNELEVSQKDWSMPTARPTATPVVTAVPVKQETKQLSVTETAVPVQEVARETALPTEKPTATPTPATKVQRISIPAAINLAEGGSMTLAVEIVPGDCAYTVSSNNPAVVSVSGKNLYGKKAGNCVVTVSAGGKTASCHVNVTK